MTSRVLVDTGPLVAIVSKNDAYHRICTDTLRQIDPPMLTCWPVLAEVTWLLRKHPSAIQKVLDSVESGLLGVEDLDHAAVPWIAGFLKRYRKLGAQLADAAGLPGRARWTNRGFHFGSPGFLGVPAEPES